MTKLCPFRTIITESHDSDNNKIFETEFKQCLEEHCGMWSILSARCMLRNKQC